MAEKSYKKISSKFVELRAFDMHGRAHRFTYCHDQLPRIAKEGIAISGKWLAGPGAQPVVLMPDFETAFVDPFYVEETTVVFCSIYGLDGQSHPLDTRYMVKKAEAEMSKILPHGGKTMFNTSISCFIFDNAHDNTPTNCHCSSDDDLYDIRGEIVLTLQAIKVPVISHKSGNAKGHCEFTLNAMSPTELSDAILKLRYVVENVARSYNKRATFMPRPFGDSVRAHLYLHQDLFARNGDSLANPKYKDHEVYKKYTQGVCDYIRTFEVFTNPTTNSYMPPENCTSCIANAGHDTSTHYCGEYGITHFDAAANPCLVVSAMVAAGCLGVQKPAGKGVCNPAYSLCGAIANLEQPAVMQLVQRAFSVELVRAYIDAKHQEMARIKRTVHPVEYELYY